jgi:hypothetical protein
LTVLLGNGDGRFQKATDSPFALPHQRFSPDTTPFGLLSSDFNHDGLLDLAARADSPGLMVLWQAAPKPPVARGGSLPLGQASGLLLVGVNRAFALLSGPSRLVIVRLRDGKLTSLAYPRGTAGAVVGARLTEAGLFYAYNVRKGTRKGRIVFVPTASLLARF